MHCSGLQSRIQQSGWPSLQAPSLPCCQIKLIFPSRAVATARPAGHRPLVSSPLDARPAQLRRVAAVHALTTEDIDVEADTMERMEKSMDSLKGKFSTIRTGRANPAILDRIQVDYYGALTPLRQLAGISVPDSSMLVVQPYDTGAMDEIERAILESDLGINPTNDGKILRLNIPQLTAERRKEFGKTVSKLGEEGKIAIRNVRRDAMKTVDKMDDSVSEDEKKSLEDAVQDLTDDYVKQIDSMIKSKQEELEKV
ncbi:hypothetical protein WJX84_002978 [Apatococcus fuscideae]|uniref:Ribosome-recycling factor, chloroplastic n=1 Tax=Apatococcus fuscideae TaxID=2026836 RepID=A0AAW1TB31_9CHLO